MLSSRWATRYFPLAGGAQGLPYLFSAGADTNLALAASLASVGLVGSLAYQGTLQTIVAQEGKVEGI